MKTFLSPGVMTAGLAIAATFTGISDKTELASFLGSADTAQNLSLLVSSALALAACWAGARLGAQRP